MTQNYSDSLVFFLCMRESICFMIDESGVKKKKQLKEFIRNTATDYQILSLTIEGEFPEEKNNLREERFLLHSFKDLVIENIDSKENEVLFNNIMYEVGLPSNKGFSSARTLLEANVTKKADIAKKALKGELKQLQAKKNEIKKDVARLKKQRAEFSKTGEDNLRAKSIEDQILQREKQVSDVEYQETNVINRISNVANKAFQVQATYSMGKQVIGLAKAGVAGAVAAPALAVGLFAKLKGSISIPAIRRAILNSGATIGISALIALILYAAYKTYKNYLSSAARKCLGLKTRPEKNLCMIKAKVNALTVQSKGFRAGLDTCRSSDNPAKCVMKLTKRMRKINSRLQFLRGKMLDMERGQI